MSVVWKAGYGWGLRVDTQDSYELEENIYSSLPDGYDVAYGGDQMDGEDRAILAHPTDGYIEILDSNDHFGEQFGVFDAVEGFHPTIDQEGVLKQLAWKHNVPVNIGWFVVSSVG